MYKLLIVEDDPIMSKVLVSMFKSENYEVTHSATGEGAFQAATKELPDLVLMDINLPDSSGLDICRRMKSTQRVKHIPVILITGGATSVDDKVEGMEIGAEDYILKPFLADELIARVAGIVKRSLKFGEK